MAAAMARAELATNADLQGEIGLVRGDPKREIGLVRTGVEWLRRHMTIRLGAMMIGSIGIVLTAMRLMAIHSWPHAGIYRQVRNRSAAARISASGPQ
jgi:hypothetical protein